MGDGRSKTKQIGEILYQSLKDFEHDNGTHWSASIAYFSIISAFPLLIISAIAASLFIDPDWIMERMTGFVEDYFPDEDGDVQEMIEQAMERRGQVSVIAVAVLLWSGTRVFGALIAALNVARDRTHRHNFWQRRALELTLLLSIGVIFLIALATRFFLATAAGTLGVLPEDTGLFFEIGVFGITTLLLFAAFTLAYRFIPQPHTAWKPSIGGAIVATVLFAAVQPIFVYYIRELAEMSLFYGPVASIVIALFWFWIAALITIYGGEVAAHAHLMLVEGKTAEELNEKRKSRRRN